MRNWNHCFWKQIILSAVTALIKSAEKYIKWLRGILPVSDILGQTFTDNRYLPFSFTD